MTSHEEIECALQGRLTADPVQRTSKTGKAWLSMNVAVGSGDMVQYVSVALFGDTVADTAARLTKGERVYVEGRIKVNAWTDKDGRERSGLSVASFNVVPLGQIGKRKPARRNDAGPAGHQPGEPDPASRQRAPGRQQRDAAARADWQRPPGAGRDSSADDAATPF